MSEFVLFVLDGGIIAILVGVLWFVIVLITLMIGVLGEKIDEYI